jgi:hypothetical protein
LPLSPYETKVLTMIEEELRDEDPALAETLSGTSSSVPTFRSRSLFATYSCCSVR